MLNLFWFIVLTILILLLEQSDWGIEETKTRYFCICEVGTGDIWTCSSYSYKGKTTCQNNYIFHRPLSSNFNSHYNILFNNFVGILSFILVKMISEENSGCNRPHTVHTVCRFGHMLSSVSYLIMSYKMTKENENLMILLDFIY